MAGKRTDKRTAKTKAGEYIARITKLSHHYGKIAAVDAVDLQIPARCMAGLIGPDGVGKSSLLALITGVRKIQQGSIEVLLGAIW